MYKGLRRHNMGGLYNEHGTELTLKSLPITRVLMLVVVILILVSKFSVCVRILGVCRLSRGYSII